jgi:DNA-binding Xre family transcriptional regulator
MTGKISGKKKLAWKLRLTMVSKGVNTATELKRRLQLYGYEITTTHAARIVAERPHRISVELLEALVNVLDCEPNDILFIEAVEEGAEKKSVDIQQGQQKKVTAKVSKLPVRKVIADDDDESFFGPKASSIHNPYEDKAK